jgi:predicted kinase
MKSKSGGVLRWLVAIVVVASVAVAFYHHLHGRASGHIKAEVMAIADEMVLSPEQRDRLKGLLEAAHDEAFHKALDPTKKLGRKFDDRLYYDGVFDIVIARARGEGDNDLADTVERQRQHFALTVTED